MNFGFNLKTVTPINAQTSLVNSNLPLVSKKAEEARGKLFQQIRGQYSHFAVVAIARMYKE